MKTKKLLIQLSSSVVILFLLLTSVVAAGWPADSPATNVGSGLGAYYEPSGVVYHTGLNKLFVVSDEGILSMMNIDGTSVTSWTFRDAFNYNDFEGVTVADPTTNYVYALTEYPFAITQFDISTGAVVQSWSLTSIIPAPTNTRYGLEGMTYVSTEGLFAVGSQETGTIYFISVPTTTTGSSVSLVRSIQPTSSVSDLYFNAETETLYILAGSSLTESNLEGTIIVQYTVPGSGQEGVTLAPACSATTTSIFIAEDHGNTDLVPDVSKYNNYPITCPSSSSSGTTTPVDTDGDGLLDTEEATYGTDPTLVDTDSDGLTDYQEVITYGTNALVTDTDSEGLSDYQELVSYGTDALDTDTDNDGLTDYQEIITYGTDAKDTDSDNDSLTDYQEVITYGTNPLNSDSDSGSVSDAQELTNGTNPLDGSDDLPIVIDPNLISTYTIDTVNALVTVYYADGHSNTINPFRGTDSILVGLNYDNTVLVVTNGKRMKTYQNSVAKDNEYISKYTPSSMTLTITHGTSSDDVSLTFVVSGKTRTAHFTLTDTNLVKY